MERLARERRIAERNCIVAVGEIISRLLLDGIRVVQVPWLEWISNPSFRGELMAFIDILFLRLMLPCGIHTTRS
jgi:hypothetical protein